MKIPLTIINNKLLTSIALFFQRAQLYQRDELRFDAHRENHGYNWDIQWEMDVFECFCFF